MVFLLRSFVRGPLEPFVLGFAEELARSGGVGAAGALPVLPAQ
jgi:hypothetical protein